MRLVATDLDGTIVAPDGSVSPRTVTALRACEAAGIPVVIVTGRPPRWLPDVITATGLTSVAVCANGAVLYDGHHGEIVEAWTIERDVVQAVVSRLHDAFEDVQVALETTTGFVRTHGYSSTFRDLERMPRVAVDELVAGARDVIKILIRAKGSGDDLLASAQELVWDLVEATHSNANDNLLELGPRGVSKAATLDYLVEGYGISAQTVIAFGDQPNDVPMLAWAGVGVAMADGHPSALAVADEIAPPCSQDGVAQVLEARLAALGLADRGRVQG